LAKKLSLCGIALACLVAAAGPLAAQSGDTEGWQWDATIYLWRADVGGQTAGGSDINVDFGDVLDSLDYGFMGLLQARKGKWSVFGDLILLDVENTKQTGISVPIESGSIDVDASAKVQLQSFIVNLMGGYTLVQSESSDSRLDLVFGARYLDLDADLDLSWSIDGVGDSRAFTEGTSTYDGVIGVKGQIAVGRIVSIPYWFDVGTGDSDLTWQALAGLNFRATRWLDIPVIYRHLEWEFPSDRLVGDVNFSGVAAGLMFHF
jgi:hypothetical protein